MSTGTNDQEQKLVFVSATKQQQQQKRNFDAVTCKVQLRSVFRAAVVAAAEAVRVEVLVTGGGSGIEKRNLSITFLLAFSLSLTHTVCPVVKLNERREEKNSQDAAAAVATTTCT